MGILSLVMYGPAINARYGRTFDEEVLTPYDRVARAVGVGLKSRRFSARQWLERFSNEVFRLKIGKPGYVGGTATTITPVIPSAMKRLMRDERKRMVRRFFQRQRYLERRSVKAKAREANLRSDNSQPEEELVVVRLRDGERIPEKERQAALRAELAKGQEAQQNFPATHPGYPFVQLHIERNKSGRKAAEVLRRNLDALENTLNAIPDSSTQSQRRALAQHVLENLGDKPEIFYTGAVGSSRIFNCGMNLLRLPREFRRIAYGGCYEFDLVSCQLAIVSKIWDIPELHSQLSAGIDIWQVLYDHLGVDESYKPILKQGIYSLVFGAKKSNIQKKMIARIESETRASHEEATRLTKLFLHHPLIKATYRARERQQKVIDERDGVVDAFKQSHSLLSAQNYIKTTPKGKALAKKESADGDTKRSYFRWRRRAILSLMARVVQSYELDLMLSLVPVMQKDKQIYPMAFMFDAVIVEFGNKSKRERHIRHFQKAVADHAASWGISTKLDWKLLQSEKTDE